MYINNKEEFLAFIERAKSSDILCIDTEFLREKTYWAKLCLIQVATRDEIVIIDPLRIIDITPLASLLSDENIVKVFHACHQDIEILIHEVGIAPKPVFDTQIAASVLGDTQQVGLSSLVANCCGVMLKKSDSFTDWSKRPLSESQIDYAADDVRYLPAVYDKLLKELKSLNRLDWLTNDFDALSNPSTFEVLPEKRYEKLKRANHLSRHQLGAARELSIWREEQAQSYNIPRKWVLTDEQIIEMCRKEATTIDDLFLIRGVKEKLNIQDARRVIELIKKGLNLKEEELPEIQNSRKSEPNVDILVDAMTPIARLRAKENNIALQTLAPKESLEQLARGYTENNILLNGWRKKILGDDLMRFIDGKVCIKACGNSIVIE